MSFDHWVFESSSLSFLLPYRPSLRYVPCLKTTLRPWDQMLSSTASAWTGVWDSVAIWMLSCFFFWETHFWWLDSFQLCWDYRDHAFDEGWFDDTCHFLICHVFDAILEHIPISDMILQILTGLHAYPHSRDMRWDDGVFVILWRSFSRASLGPFSQTCYAPDAIQGHISVLDEICRSSRSCVFIPTCGVCA